MFVPNKENFGLAAESLPRLVYSAFLYKTWKMAVYVFSAYGTEIKDTVRSGSYFLCRKVKGHSPGVSCSPQGIKVKGRERVRAHSAFIFVPNGSLDTTGNQGRMDGQMAHHSTKDNALLLTKSPGKGTGL